ncbi:MAG: phycobilisome linker polypeptide [Gloeomargarita sp. SKYG116]|nr:phycobilisome linker polypeptide [Gloeomargarita sp. SKYG116]MCS7226213.1 phycobilisome linker polypeptide [Gloeomargarita sp. SKYB31]MDW8401771.1 phycobilisome linker polypeptide [Gloeomargarita sp. SKYGB_i_bin116]
MTTSTSAKNLGISEFNRDERIELRSNPTEADYDRVIRAAYRQVLGNDYVMASERLRFAESQLRNGNITVREFVRAIAKSELYKAKFFYPNPQVRFIELNYKHLLGRAPYDEMEISLHNDIYVNQGYDAEIDSYIDSQEYVDNFGENIVPYYRGFWSQRGQKTVGFTRMFRLYRGYANSDRAQVEQRNPRLTWNLARNTANTVIPPSGVSDAWAFRPTPTAAGPARQGALVGDSSRVYRVEVAGITGPRVRRSTQTLLVPYEQLSARMQQIQRQGGRIASITPA